MRQARGQLGQGGLQQPRVFVATQLQELHLQELRDLLGTQVQQPVAAPGVQVQAQPVPGQERERPRPHGHSIRSISCSIFCSRRLWLLLLHHCSHRKPVVLGGQTCPSSPGRPAQAGPREAVGGGMGRRELGLLPAREEGILAGGILALSREPRLDRSLLKWGGEWACPGLGRQQAAAGGSRWGTGPGSDLRVHRGRGCA